ncbi:hypothetical protein [Puia sp.]|jgi:hypothetical protein|uniref:hypothetical protein n=1 Tax=Puia sp. TaxID=2045100 RepID=UPI002F4118F0
MKKLLPLANIFALAATIIINYLSNTGAFGGNTIASVSAAFPTYFMPARYAFSIWSLIYLALIGFAAYQGRALSGNSEATTLVDRIGGWFLLSCIANSCWVLAFVYGDTGLSILLMLVLALSLMMIIRRTDMELTDPPFRTILFVWWPFCLYAGWISLAFFANLAFWLRKIEWNGLGIHAAIWAIIFVFIAGALHLYMTWERNMREFALVGVWGLVAIAIGNLDRAWAVSVAAFGMAGILFISSGLHGYRNRATSPFRR